MLKKQQLFIFDCGSWASPDWDPGNGRQKAGKNEVWMVRGLDGSRFGWFEVWLFIRNIPFKTNHQNF